MRVITLIFILITIVFAGVPSARAQSTSVDSERIRKLREEIQKRETAETPDDLIELNRSKLLERRAELRTLLKSEMLKLQKHQRDMASFISSDEIQRINDLLQTYTAEVDRLGASMQKDLAADATAVSAKPADSPGNSLTPNASNGSASGREVSRSASGPSGGGSGMSAVGVSVANVSSPGFAMVNTSLPIAVNNAAPPFHRARQPIRPLIVTR